METIAIIHVAGPMVAGIQKCIRCGTILIDTRGVMFPTGQKPLSWPQDFVTVDGNFAFAGQSQLAQHCDAAVQ